jgi:hypothetical protein
MPTQQPPTPVASAGGVIAIEARRRPGRPKTIRRAPDANQIQQYERVRQRLRLHVAADPVVQVASKPADRTSTETIDETMRQLALEAAGLAWDRERAQVEGRGDPERIASRRISALSRIADLALERARLGEDHFDPYDARVQTIMRAFVARMREAAEQTLEPRALERFLADFDARLAGWESRVER